jgi:hypothetical protein
MEVEMKMVRSLLLGTAAGFVAVAGAQAADMPVKAKPVQYVKICTLYGDGFYYIPGTDICLKIGGYVRAEYAYNYGPSMTNGPFANVSGFQTRTDGQDFTMRSRAYAWFDSRQQTEYGTLRTYLQLGLNFDNPAGNAFNGNRAFIQFAGFTAGLAQSFYDFYSSPATSYFGPPSSDTGDPGWKVFAYTANFGNGLSSTVSIEEPRSFGTASAPAGGIINTNFATNIFTVNNAGPAIVVSDKAKARFPDLVSNWRLDQAWGAAQIMFAAHDASGGYYTNIPATNVCAGLAANGNTGTLTGSEICGHPADKLGWAAGLGAKLNTYAGSYFQFQVNYTQGALRYVTFTPAGGYSPVQFSGQNVGFGFFSDGVFSNATGDVQLTTAWGVNAAYEHFWTPALRTSLYGFYDRITYNDNANAAMCTNMLQATAGAITFAGGAAGAALPGTSNVATCNQDFNWWGVGTRSQWNITPWFYVGVDVLYQKIETASAGAIVTYTAAAGTAKPTALYTVQNQDNVGIRVRLHRDIVP